MVNTHPAQDITGVEDARRSLVPSPVLEKRIRSFIASQLAGVLPTAPARGLDPYFDTVVLGSRAVDAYRVVAGRMPAAGSPVIDVGSGLGTFVLLSRRLGLPAVGIEPGEDELALARERARELHLPPDLFRTGAGERLPFPDGSAGAVLMQDVLEHVSDWRAVLQEAARVLAPGGFVYVKGPSYSMRLFEPHYRVPWLPMMPRSLAQPYLRLLGRDPSYMDHIGYRRRGEVLTELRRLELVTSFPRLEKLGYPETINRPWARRLVRLTMGARLPARLAAAIAEGPFQSTIDVVAQEPQEDLP